MKLFNLFRMFEESENSDDNKKMRETYYIGGVTLNTINNGAGKYGFADADGKVVVPPKWDKLNSWSPPIGEYNYIKVFRKGIFRKGKYGLLANDGTKLIPPVMDEIKDYVFIPDVEWRYRIGENFAWIVKNGKEGIFSLIEKKIIIPPVYDSVECSYHIKDGFEASIELKNVYFDKHGKVLYQLKNGIEMVGKPGRLALVKKNGKYGFIDRDGVIVEPIVHEDASYDVIHEEVTIDGVKGEVKYDGKISMHNRTWVDENGNIYEPDVETESGIYIYTKPRILIIPFDERIHLDDIIYIERVEGEPGEVTHRKIYSDGKYEEYVKEYSIGGTQHDYYDYMDHQENELHIYGKGFGYCVEDKDAEFLWHWFMENF